MRQRGQLLLRKVECEWSLSAYAGNKNRATYVRFLIPGTTMMENTPEGPVTFGDEVVVLQTWGRQTSRGCPLVGALSNLRESDGLH